MCADRVGVKEQRTKRVTKRILVEYFSWMYVKQNHICSYAYIVTVKRVGWARTSYTQLHKLIILTSQEFYSTVDLHTDTHTYVRISHKWSLIKRLLLLASGQSVCHASNAAGSEWREGRERARCSAIVNSIVTLLNGIFLLLNMRQEVVEPNVVDVAIDVDVNVDVDVDVDSSSGPVLVLALLLVWPGRLVGWAALRFISAPNAIWTFMLRPIQQMQAWAARRVGPWQWSMSPRIGVCL